MKAPFINKRIKQSVRVVSMGSMALGWIFRSENWQVIATFKRCFYCRDNRENIICIGQAEIGKGPFTLLCSAESPWPEHAIAPNMPIRVRKNQMLLEGPAVLFDLHGAQVWNKSLRTISGKDDRLLTDIRWIAGKVVSDAPAESLGMVLSSFFPVNVQKIKPSSSILTASLHKSFVEVIAEVRRLPLLLPGGQCNTSLAEVLCRLIGLGPGLTPSGDDFLAGIVMGLFKAGQEDEAAWLAHYFHRTARGRVTAISLAFYRALSEGLVVELYHQFLDSIGTGEYLHLERLLKQVSRFGGTSGWDTITGILFGFSLVLADQNDRRNHTMEAVY